MVLFALFWHLDRVFLITAISAGYYSNETVTIHLTASGLLQRFHLHDCEDGATVMEM